jgi:uncharacterized protein DUF2505
MPRPTAVLCLAMPRSFEVSAESPASVDQVHSAFGDENYWRARLAVFGGGPWAATLDSLIVDAAGTVVVATTFSLLRDRLPKLVNQLGRGDLQMVHTETWSRVGGKVRGQVGITVPGTPLSATGGALLAPLDNGSRLQYSATVKVNVPLVGGQIESFMSSRLSEGIMDIQRFTTAWICENGRPAKLRRFGKSM